MMKEISVKLVALAEERNKFHFRNMVVENRDEFTKSRETSSLLTLPELIGRNQDKEKIIKVLLEAALERDELVSVLSIWSMDKVNYIDDDLPDGGPVRGFPSLEVLTMKNLSSLKGLSRQEGKELFPLLRRMEIENFDGNEEAICFPEEVLRNLTLLKSLDICQFTKLKSFPNGLAHLKALNSLYISHCHKLKSLPEEGLRGLESLQCLSIRYCEEFSSLSKGLQHLVCLESLVIFGCPKLVALPEGIKHLKSLQRLEMGGYSAMSLVPCAVLVALPETLQHVPALRYLFISSYPTLISLPDWLGNLTTLQSLIISCCLKISSLPASIQRLTELRSLLIFNCGPELARRCEKGKGKDWHKIAQIPQVDVDAPTKPKGYNGNTMAASSEVVAASVQMHCWRKLVGCSGGLKINRLA
ncbi:hypothetical protein RHSIM_Rhsim05G0016800 [Rhododendron simsii]|uniref:Uncharacterized protein n=1 Tax=Rhododendron simsii TaxID=118357 RepID=A0A834H6I0_RHOSS|nr:hypothetical protein RHSIM_Rhsim05G0016800 [Rhododendron simsii]